MRPGRRIAFDWGKARIGVAACDTEGILAFPVETIPVSGGEFLRARQLVVEYEPIECVLGMPTTLSGKRGIAAEQMIEIAGRLAAEVGIPVRIVDERMSTAVAAKQLASAGKNAKRQRAIIDQAAAVGILNQALAAEQSGQLPGKVITEGNQGV